MKATWSIWFGKIDQPDLGDALIAQDVRLLVALTPAYEEEDRSRRG